MIFWGQDVMQIKNYAVVNFSFTLRGRHLGFQDGRQSRHINANYSKTVIRIKIIFAATPPFSGSGNPSKVEEIQKMAAILDFKMAAVLGLTQTYYGHLRENYSSYRNTFCNFTHVFWVNESNDNG